MGDRRAIFITGGGSGIGRAVAVYFGQRGWFVGLGDIDKAGMRETEEMIANGFVYSHPLDVRDAGVPLGGSLTENSAEEIERTLDINLKGVLFGAQAAYPYLKRTAPGSCLLNTASAAGLYGTPGASVYSATKFGVRAVTESLDGEWAVDGINVRSLMPSFIDTPLLDHNPNARSNEDIRQRVTGAGLEITRRSRMSLLRHGPPSTATSCIPSSARPLKRWRSAHAGCLAGFASRRAR